MFLFLSISLLTFSPTFAGVSPKGDSDFGKSKLLSKVFIKRHSGENFLLKPLQRDQIEALIQSARWSPSSFNDQPWNFIICNYFKNKDSHAKVVNSIYGQEWVENAPLLVVVVTRKNYLYNDEENEWAEYDTGAAAISMSLQATKMDLMAHQVGGFDKEEIVEALGIPNGFEPKAIIAIGYEDKEQKNNNSRSRRAVKENFFFDHWGQSKSNTNAKKK